MTVLGAILCGGRSSRFGSDKALAMLDGRTLIDHVRAALAPQVDGLVACGRVVAGLRSIVDRPAADLGPLGGLNAALHAALAEGYAAVLSVPCDVPLLPSDLRRRMEPAAPVYLAAMPVIGLWPAALAPRLADFILTDARRSIRGWANRVGATALEIDRPIANINAPADLDRLASGLTVGRPPPDLNQ